MNKREWYNITINTTVTNSNLLHTNASGAEPAGKLVSVRHRSQRCKVLQVFLFSFFILEISASQTGEHLEGHALVNRLGGLSLPRKSVVRLTDRPNMTLDVYRGRKTTMQHGPEVFDCNWQNLEVRISPHTNFLFLISYSSVNIN